MVNLIKYNYALKELIGWNNILRDMHFILLLPDMFKTINDIYKLISNGDEIHKTKDGYSINIYCGSQGLLVFCKFGLYIDPKTSTRYYFLIMNDNYSLFAKEQYGKPINIPAFFFRDNDLKLFLIHVEGKECLTQSVNLCNLNSININNWLRARQNDTFSG